MIGNCVLYCTERVSDKYAAFQACDFGGVS
jgi:hypothetical protein